MALTLRCDGCECELPLETQAVGWYDPAFYCEDCRGQWDACEQELRARQVILAIEYESYRTERMAQARGCLKKCPDDDGRDYAAKVSPENPPEDQKHGRADAGD